MAYRICQECGATLDPGERCDCTMEQESQANGKTSDKQRMVNEAADLLSQLYYEDVDFIHGFIVRFAQKKGVKKAAPDAANIQSGKVESA